MNIGDGGTHGWPSLRTAADRNGVRLDIRGRNREAVERIAQAGFLNSAIFTTAFFAGHPRGTPVLVAQMAATARLAFDAVLAAGAGAHLGRA